MLGQCAECKQAVVSTGKENKDYIDIDEETILCKWCYADFYVISTCCTQLFNAGDISYNVETEEYLCNKCHKIEACPTCNHEYFDGSDDVIFDEHCPACEFNPQWCDSCGDKHTPSQVIIHFGADPANNQNEKAITLCKSCADSFTKCACNLIQHQETVNVLGSLNVCQGCVQYENDGTPVYVSIYA